MMKIALFGTSADPPTEAHGAIARWLASQFDGVALWAASNPFKENQTPYHHRSEMLYQLVTALQPSYPNLIYAPELSDDYSFNSLLRAEARWPEATLIFVVGTDVVATLSHWYRAAEFLQRVPFLVIPRPGFGLDPQVLATLRDRGTQIELAQFQGPDISSTQARKEQEDGSFCADLPAVVRTYIEAQGLYRQKV